MTQPLIYWSFQTTEMDERRWVVEDGIHTKITHGLLSIPSAYWSPCLRTTFSPKTQVPLMD